MPTKFSINIAPSVTEEINLASKARAEGYTDIEFKHYENAHVLGQESTFWHVKAHFLMLSWAFRNAQLRELLGQLLRIVGAATKTVFGLVPKGNTGGTNVSPFKVMPICPAHQEIINRAKSSS